VARECQTSRLRDLRLRAPLMYGAFKRGAVSPRYAAAADALKSDLHRPLTTLGRYKSRYQHESDS